MSASALFDGYSMDGIADLIAQWLDAEPGRYQKDLASICGVTPKTIGRWYSGESTPDSEHWDALAVAFGLDVEAVASAARESKRRQKPHHPRATQTRLRVIDERFVLTPDDMRRWREAVKADESLSRSARDVLRTFTSYFEEENSLEVFVDQEQLAVEWAGLTLDVIEDVWPEVVESSYVKRRNFPGAGWVFWLQFPDEK